MRRDSSKAIVQTTLPEVLVADLAGAIFRGEYSPGDRLPPIRTLADTYGVTSATCQRAIARLEEIGLLAVKQGSGMTVLDPMTNAGSSALGYWLESVLDHPDQASAILADFLELRREIAVNQLLRVREQVRDIGSEMLAATVAQLPDGDDDGSVDPRVVADADFAMTRALLALRPQMAYSTVLNMFERLVRATPDLLEAMHADPSRAKSSFVQLVELLRSSMGDTEVRRGLDEVIAAADATTVSRFRQILLRKKAG